jgi:azurin
MEKKRMFDRRNTFVIFVLFILLSAAPILAASGSATYSLSKTMFMANTKMQAGDYQMKYKSNGPEVTVTVKCEGKVVATVQGKLEKLDKPTDYTSLLIGKDSTGREVIEGLQFGGKKYRVVFQ